MIGAKSKVTAQSQISIAADVLKSQEGRGQIVDRRAGSFSSGDIHTALFGPKVPETRTLDELKEGIRHYAKRRRAH